MKLICLIFIFFIFYTQPKDTKQQIFLQRNEEGLKFGNFRHLHRHRLNIPAQETLELDKEIQCVSSCIKKPDCFSLNTKKTTDDKFFCEFLNTSKYQNHDNLTKDDNFVHWYFGDPCLPQPCIQGKCSASDSTKTEFTCDCYPWALGERCDFNDTYNVALQKPTVQSSTTGDWISSLAVDGNTDNNGFLISICALTNKAVDGNAWWRVDLQQEIPVARIVITNRWDYGWTRLSNFEIRIGNSLDDEGRVNPKCGDTHSIVTRGVTKTITCLPPVSGRYLLLNSLTTSAINVCEVQVYAGP